MIFIKSAHLPSALLATAALVPNELNVESPNSIAGVAKTLAAAAMSYYPGSETEFVDLEDPYYWWECGALMGSMLDYSHMTRDQSYDKTIATALLAQTGPDLDFMLPTHFGQEGNDDQAFWGFAIMTAAERNFPQPDAAKPAWLHLGVNIWNSLVSRWNTTFCGGGLPWQIFADNPNGLDYKNSVSNGGLFQLSARLARATGNTTYLDWTNKVWDWSVDVGFVDSKFNVLDGADAKNNCTKVNPISFSYSAGIYLYGAAVMANHTGDPVWADRAAKLLTAAESFFGPYKNATNIMFEHACEPVNRCNTDMLSFKAYLSRFMYASTHMLPALTPHVLKLMLPSASAAAQSCDGAGAATTSAAACGTKWYVDGFDGNSGLGQQMSALEAIQGLLIGKSTPPLRGTDIKHVADFA